MTGEGTGAINLTKQEADTEAALSILCDPSSVSWLLLSKVVEGQEPGTLAVSPVARLQLPSAGTCLPWGVIAAGKGKLP